MANKIARGTTGQASFGSSTTDSSTNREGWYMSSDVYDYLSYNSDPPTHYVHNIPGWIITTDGEVTVPASMPAGLNVSFLTHKRISPTLTKTDSYSFVVVCMKETVSISQVTWNATTGKWDYLVTITAEGGTPPYSPSRPGTQTISLFPKESYTLATTTSDSGSCSDSNSTVIGPAPDAPPVAGPCFDSGAPAASNLKRCGANAICTPTSGNNIVSGDSGNPQSYENYAGGGNKDSAPLPK